MSEVLGAPGWKLYLEEDSGKPYYHQESSGKTIWRHPLDPTNPLTPPGHEADPVDGAPGWLMYKDSETSKSFYHNPVTGATRWDHPLSGYYSAMSLWLVLGGVVAILLLLLVVAVMRRQYFAAYHPEMLRTQKAVERDRAARRQAASGQTMKYRRPRFKMSQDGKGGRSANS